MSGSGNADQTGRGLSCIIEARKRLSNTRAFLQPCTYVSQSTIILMLGSPSCMVLPLTPMLSPCSTSPGCLCVICCHFQLESAAPFLRDLYGGHDNSQESVPLQDSLGFDQVNIQLGDGNINGHGTLAHSFAKLDKCEGV